MPIYEYVCRRCGSEFEILHRTAKKESPHCPQCGAAEAERRFSVFGFSCGESFVSSSSKESNCSSCHSRNCSHCG